MFPIRDENPTLRTPVVTWVIIAVNVAAWMLLQGAGEPDQLAASVCELGLIPGELLHRLPVGTQIPMGSGWVCQVEGGNWLSPLTSMFMHGGWGHLLGNMWFLHIFGNNVEDSMGRLRYLVFYLLVGLAAAASQVLVSPDSAVPMVGASGAIGGVMGAYVMLYPRVAVDVWFPPVFRFVWPAWAMLGVWFFLDNLLPASLTLGLERQGGTAFWAHIGGFMAGILLVIPFRDPELVAQHRAGAHYWRGESRNYG
ncbi:MAG TPA: rhomboid family intramembrane serine protease [Gemmatimonadales bacterium]|nr:rhomboid family intramembrane serine protease [Gemmatimonadales bacterium]